MGSVLTLKPSYYQALLRLTLELAGVNLGAGHEFLIETRLGALARREGYESLSAMIEELFSTGQTRLAVQVVSTLLERDTQFFEDMDGYHTLVDKVIPSVLGQTSDETIRILSFGCSSGQEPYSLLMMLAEMNLKSPVTKFDITAVDYPSMAMDRAREGRYTHFEVQRGLPISKLVKYFDRKGEDWVIKKTLRKGVTFKDVHLLSKLDELGDYHIVLFRNNLSHYSSPAQVRVLRSLSKTVKHEGYLMLGTQETLNHINYGYDDVKSSPGTYRRYAAAPIKPPIDPDLKTPSKHTTFEKARKRGAA